MNEATFIYRFEVDAKLLSFIISIIMFFGFCLLIIKTMKFI